MGKVAKCCLAYEGWRLFCWGMFHLSVEQLWLEPQSRGRNKQRLAFCNVFLVLESCHLGPPTLGNPFLMSLGPLLSNICQRLMVERLCRENSTELWLADTCADLRCISAVAPVDHRLSSHIFLFISSSFSGCPRCSPYVCFSPSLNLELQLRIQAKITTGGSRRTREQIYRPHWT